MLSTEGVLDERLDVRAPKAPACLIRDDQSAELAAPGQPPDRLLGHSQSLCYFLSHQH